MKETWLSLVRQLDLTENVKFVGLLPHQDLLSILAGCDLGYSGHFDLKGRQAYRSPLKLYEYMAMAKPVLASAIEGTTAIIREGETGFLFQPNDKYSLKQALLRAFASQNQLQQMGEKARRNIEVNHSWTNRVQMLIERTIDILPS